MTWPSSSVLRFLAVAATVALVTSVGQPAAAVALEGGYAVVVSKQTYGDAQWKAVADALVAKYGGKLLTVESDVASALPALKEAFPRYTCFVATPAEAGRDYVAAVHRMVKKLDDDPYADTIWGILTGFDAADALRVAKNDKPLVVRKVASGTEVALDRCPEGIWYCELKQGKMVRKEAGGEAVVGKGPADTTAALADTLNTYRADLFVTSGHATERDWQIGYTYPNGTFRSKAGELFGLSRAGERTPIRSDNPKVYLPIGNCLMGHIDGPDAMALAWMHSANVQQMIGYTVPTWYGYAGWGMLDYFVEQPGRYSMAEAFAANDHALIHRLSTYFPEIAQLNPPPGKRMGPRTVSAEAKAAGLSAMDGAGLLHDRDVVAFYGDPAWNAHMTGGALAYDQELTQAADGVHTLTIRPLIGAKSFAPVNTNGAQRGGRPIVAFLPKRIGKVEVLKGAELKPVITDDFILIPNPGKWEEGKELVVKFRAE